MVLNRHRLLGGLCGLLVLLLASAVVQAAPTAAGRVIIASGEAFATGADGQRRSLRRRAPVFAGDTVGTGEHGRMQLRFEDGATMALRENSLLRIDEYVFDSNTPEQGRSVSTLLKGGFRTITGIIGKQDPDAYRVDTPVASIGVRGTHYEVVLGQGLVVGAWKGGVRVRNRAGSLDIGKGGAFNFARVRAPDQAPAGELAPPAGLEGRLPPPLPEPVDEDSAEGGSEAPEAVTADAGDQSTTADVVDSDAAGMADSDESQADDGEVLIAGTADSGGSGVTTTEPVTLLEPVFVPDPVPDTLTDGFLNDPRLSALEKQRLVDDGRIGMMILSGPAPKSFINQPGALTGGRATAADLGPVIAVSTVDPSTTTFDELFNSGISEVYRPGTAPQLPPPMPVPDAPGYGIQWGAWDAAPGTPVVVQVDASDPAHMAYIEQPVFWATAVPVTKAALDSRSGIVNFSNVVAAFGHGSSGGGGGQIVTADFTFTANINFNTGDVTAGLIEIGQSPSTFPDYWSVNFTGRLNGPLLEVEPNNISGSVTGGFGSDSVRGEIGGIVTGPSANAVGGGFSFEAETMPGVHADGLFLVTE